MVPAHPNSRRSGVRQNSAMRVLVAGASGALGRRLLPRLVAAGHDVVGITRTEAHAAVIRTLGGRPVVADALEPAQLDRALASERFDGVISQLTDLPRHLNLRRIGDAYDRNNRVRVHGTANVIDAALQRGAKRAVVQSMATWYAPRATPAVETDPLYLDAPEPVGTAVRALQAMENHLYARALDGVILRYGVFYGPGTWYARDGALWHEVKERRLPILDPGDGIYSFLHIDDAAAATIVALERAPSGIFNVVDDEPAPASQWIPAYAQSIGAPAPLRVPRLMARMVGGGFVEWEGTIPPASNAKFKRAVGWQPRLASWRAGFREVEEAGV